jgi:hypothetical protein
MLDVLAQIDWGQTGTVVVAVIAAVGGQKGLESLIVAWRGKRATSRPNGDADGKYVPQELCLVRHTEEEKLQNARYLAIAQDLRDLKENVGRIHERIDNLANHEE